MNEINLNNKDIMDSKEASKIWGKASNYVRLRYKQSPNKFPSGSIRKFGRSWVVTTEAITGIKDYKKADGIFKNHHIICLFVINF